MCCPDPCAFDPCADTLFAVESTCQLVEDTASSSASIIKANSEGSEVEVRDYKDYQCECTIDLFWNVPTRTCVGGQGDALIACVGLNNIY